MIDPKELRIGNAIWDESRQKVKWVNHRVINDLASNTNPLQYLPIPITEEWMVRLGFKKHRDFNTDIDCRFYYLDSWDVCLINNKAEFVCNSLSAYYTLTSIKYIHQLQNLYFALTGTELEYKP